MKAIMLILIIIIILILIITTSGKLMWLWTPREASITLRGVRKQNIL